MEGGGERKGGREGGGHGSGYGRGDSRGKRIEDDVTRKRTRALRGRGREEEVYKWIRMEGGRGRRSSNSNGTLTVLMRPWNSPQMKTA